MVPSGQRLNGFIKLSASRNIEHEAVGENNEIIFGRKEDVGDVRKVIFGRKEYHPT